MNTELVSIVIATYNMGEYLCGAIDSVLNQTYENIEVIVVDDGSSDSTSEVIKPYLSHPQVSYFFQENSGQPKAKNKGIELAKGDFIAFCDADDLWCNDKLERQLPLFAKPGNIGVVYSDIGELDENDQLVAEKSSRVECYSGNVIRPLLIKNFVPFGTAIVKRQCLDELGVFNENYPMGIDWDLWLRIATRYEFYHLPEVTYLYRVWDGQMSSNYQGRYQWAIAILENFQQSHPNIVEKKYYQQAWADMYVGRGRVLMANEQRFVSAFCDYLRALSNYPLYVPAWKSLAKLFLGRG